MWSGPQWNGWKQPNLNQPPQDNSDVYLLFFGIAIFVIGALCLSMI